MSTVIHTAVDDLMKRVAALENQQDYRTALAMLATALQSRCPMCHKLPVLQVIGDVAPRLYLKCTCNSHVVDGGNDIEAGLRRVGQIWLEM